MNKRVEDIRSQDIALGGSRRVVNLLEGTEARGVVAGWEPSLEFLHKAIQVGGVFLGQVAIEATMDDPRQPVVVGWPEVLELARFDAPDNFAIDEVWRFLRVRSLPLVVPPVSAVTGALLDLGDYEVVLTIKSAVGESLPTPIAAITIDTPTLQSISVTVPAFLANQTKARIFIRPVTDPVSAFLLSSEVGVAGPVNINTLPLPGADEPPASDGTGRPTAIVVMRV